MFEGGMGGGTAHGFYGILGHWFGKHIPDFYAYAVRRDNLVVITHSGKPAIIVSPEQPEQFVQAVKLVLGQR